MSTHSSLWMSAQKQDLKVVIYSGSYSSVNSSRQELSQQQRASLCGLLAALSLSQAGFEVRLIDGEGPSPSVDIAAAAAIPLTSGLRHLFDRLHSPMGNKAEERTIELDCLKKAALVALNKQPHSFTSISSRRPASFDLSLPSSGPGLLLADGEQVKGDVLLCCDPTLPILTSEEVPSSSPSLHSLPSLEFKDAPWSATHRSVFGPAAYNFRFDSETQAAGKREGVPPLVERLELAQYLLDAHCLTFVLSQASTSKVVGVALQVFSDFRRDHLRALVERLRKNAGNSGETAASVEDFMHRDWLRELEEDWSRRYLSNI